MLPVPTKLLPRHHGHLSEYKTVGLVETPFTAGHGAYILREARWVGEDPKMNETCKHPRGAGVYNDFISARVGLENNEA